MLYHARRLLFLFCLLCITSPACGKEGAYTDAASAGPDFAVQGEYAESDKPDQESAYGAQVIALGDGRFDLVLYRGGLPGDGWKRGDRQEKATGESQDGAVRFQLGERTVTIQDGVLTLTDARGQMDCQLKKTERKSPTLGEQPPEGAVVLFDGSSLDNWNNGQLVEENLLGATNCETKQKFGDHQLHLEFRTPFMPKHRGQGRGNSGVYMQSRYELQVLDSFALDGKNNECGGIYTIAEPIVNMCLPPLSWQTYDYDFTAARYDQSGKKVKNARVTIRHNGVLIHDDLELPNGTPGRHAEGPGPAPLFLQDHSDPVVFRNIWAVEK